MEKRIDYRKGLENNKKKKRMAKLGILSTFGIIGVTGAIPAFASEWTANSPESIQIEQGATSYTMKQGDTLWAIGMKLNINVNTLASVNNIDLSNGQQYSLPVGTVINFSETEISAVNSDGQAINKGVKVNDSNKIVADKPIGTDVSQDVANGTASNSDVIGQPDNTGDLPAPNNNDGTQTGSTEQETPSNGEDTSPVTPEQPIDPTPTDPEKPVEPSIPTNKDVFTTVNIDENGNILDSTEGYELISETTDDGVIETLDNGNTITTYTTTKVWRLIEEPAEPTNEDRYVTINVDTEGNILSSTEGYSFISESTHSDVQTLPDGNTITTYTTTKVWQKDEVTPPVNNHYVGQELYRSQAFATTTEADAHMWEISNYWFDYAFANNIAVTPSWFGGGPYYVTIVVSAINVN